MPLAASESAGRRSRVAEAEAGEILPLEAAAAEEHGVDHDRILVCVLQWYVKWCDELSV